MRYGVLLAAFVACLVTGCRGGYRIAPGVIVTGKVIQGGKPLSVPNLASGEGYIRVQLCPQSARADGSPGDATAGEYNPSDGSVTFQYAGKGIAPGKYLLTVEASDGTTDLLKRKFGLDKSKYHVTVPENKVGATYDFGTIDLDTPPAAVP